MTQQSRQLAAILFTDIAGYAKLMGSNEAIALDLVRRNRELQKTIIEKHRGQWIKEMGDGTLARFDTALDAVNCGMEIQQQATASLDAPIRIGIHLGDITIENNDVYGDGVNIASRIESIAEPGSVYVSGSVYGAIQGASDWQGQFIGEKKLKHVDYPIKVYKMLASSIPVDSHQSSLRKWGVVVLIAVLTGAIGFWQFSVGQSNEVAPSILILPLSSGQGDSLEDAFLQGVSDELIRNMGKIQNFRVFDSETSRVFMASVFPLAEAREKVESSDFFLKGKLMFQDPMVEFDMVLYNRLGDSIWGSSFSDDKAKIPMLTATIGRSVADLINVEINDEATNQIEELKPIDPELYALWIKGLNQINIWNPSSFEKARILLNEAVERHPTDPRCWAILAEGLVSMGHSSMPPEGVWREAKAAALRALQLDSLNAEAWAALAHTKTYFEWDYDGAEIAYHKANQLNPSNGWNHYHYAWHLYLHGHLEEAIIEHKKAQDLNPLRPGHTAWLGMFYLEQGDTAKARQQVDRAFQINQRFPPAHFVLGELFLREENYDSAIVHFQKGYEIAGECIAYFKKGDLAMGHEVLNKIKSSPSNALQAWNLATVYAEIDSIDQFFEYVFYDPPFWATPWLRQIVKNPSVINDPRYKQLMSKMNLPMPEGYDLSL